MLKKEIHFKTSCHTRLFKPNVFTQYYYLFFIIAVIINTLQKHCKKIGYRKSPLSSTIYFHHRLDYSVTRLLFECDFSPMRGGTYVYYYTWQITLQHLYYCTGWLLTASRQCVNQCIGEYGSFIIKCIGLLQFIWPEIIGHLPHN